MCPNQEPAPARSRTSDRSSPKFRTTINSAKIRVRTPSEGVTSRLSFVPRVNVDILLAGSTACSARRAVFRRDWPVAGRFLGAAIGRHAAFDCWRGNGINLSMLSRARHESIPRPCAIKNLMKGSQETRMQDGLHRGRLIILRDQSWQTPPGRMERCSEIFT